MIKQLKSLIVLGALLIMFPHLTFASIDPATYNEYDGFVCTNKWVVSRGVNEAEWGTCFLNYDNSKQRSATIFEQKVIVGYSKPVETLINGVSTSTHQANICIFDLQTGAFEKSIDLTYNGEAITGTSCANQIGIDSFGNLWITGLRKATDPIKVYTIDDINNGNCSLVADIPFAYNATMDFYDVIGDITGKNSHSVLASSARGEHTIFQWKREKGSKIWQNVLTYTLTTTHPETADVNDGPSMVSIVDNESHNGETFIYDSFTTYPVKYNTQGEILGGFIEMPYSYMEVFPTIYTNGCIEFEIANRQFLAYSLGQPTDKKNQGCMAIADITYSTDYDSAICWLFTSLGTESDGGSRFHCIDLKKVVDKNGKEAVYLLNYKSNNGLGVYLISEKGFNEMLISGVEEDKISTEFNPSEKKRYDIYGRILTKPIKGINIIKMSDGSIRKEILK